MKPSVTVYYFLRFCEWVDRALIMILADCDDDAKRCLRLAVIDWRVFTKLLNLGGTAQ